MAVSDQASGYPPDPHVLRDLAFTTERTGAHTIVRARATSLLSQGSDHLGLGVLAILLDVSGASTAIEAVQPDWIATVDLTYHGRPMPLGPVVIDVAPVRVGKNLVVMGADVYPGDITGTPLGQGLITFTRIPGSATTATIESDTRSGPTTMAGARPLDEPIEQRLGITVIDASTGQIEMPHHDYARNSFGTINGGVVGLLCEEAARHRATHLLGQSVAGHGLEVHYLAQARTGPARTSTTVLRADDHGATVRVEVVDTGADDTLLAVGMVLVATLG
ncbi:MAG: PaaI family thioesterase [Acidimicrobiales bacterium]